MCQESFTLKKCVKIIFTLKNVWRKFFTIQKCVKKVFHLKKMCLEGFFHLKKICWDSLSSSHFVWRFPFTFIKLFLKFLKWMRKSAKEWWTQKSSAGGSMLPPVDLENKVKLMLHHIPARLHTKSYSNTFDLSDIYSQYLTPGPLGVSP